MLLESLVAITLITVIMTALTSFFITTVSSASQQRSQQSAIQIANTAIELTRGVGAAGAVAGRGAGAVDAQLAGPVAKDGRVAPWLTAMTAATGSGTTPTLPTTAVPRQLGTNTFAVNYFVGFCWRSLADSAASAACSATQSTGTTQYVRGVVAVTWPDNRCPNRQCVYVTATLLNGGSEPLFNLNNAPATPPALTCAAQSSAVGEALLTDGKPGRSILTNKDAGTTGCTTTGGVPTFTYSATGLPAGLTMSGDGTAAGTATGPAGNATVTLTVRDSFLRTASATFTWTVHPALVLTPPGAQSSPVGTSVVVYATASGGSGAPYSFTATGLPDGLAIAADSGAISGTPTRPGTFTPVLTVTDSSGTRTTQASFGWTVSYPPLVLTTPPNQVTTVGTAVNLALQSSGGSGSVTWSDPGGTLPTGLRIQGSSVVGTPTVRVANRQVTVTATDTTATQSRTTTFTWTVDDGPITSTSPDRTSTVSRPVTPSTLTASGGTAPYSWSDPNRSLPAGIALSSAGVLSGTPTTVGTSAVSVVVTDSGGRGSQVTFTWTVVGGPSITSPGNQQTDQRSAVSLPLASTCPNGPCTFAVTAGSLPAGLTVNASTGVISGTAAATNSVSPGIQLTVTDASGATAATAAFRWIVTDLTFGTFPNPQTTPFVRGCPANCGTPTFSNVVDMTVYDNGGTGGYAYTYLGVTGGGAYFGGNNGDLSKIKVSSTGATGSTVTLKMRVTDSSGAVKETTFSWTTQ